MRSRRLLAALTLVAALAACTSPPTTAAPAETSPAAVDVAPTKGSGDVEQPQDQGDALPVLTTAVAGTGAGNLVAPDTVCVFWTWGGDGSPQLTDGLSFRVDHPVVVPSSWTPTRDVCDDAGVPWCDGAQITVDASTCAIGFVRSGDPEPHAFVGMVGTLQCRQPLSQDDCVALAHQVDDAADVSPDLDLESVAGSGTP